MLTWVEINKNNLLYNIKQFRNLAPDSQFWPVVKSNAYGHGLKDIVTELGSNEDISGFMVASLDEALNIKDLTNKPIVVLSYFDLEDSKILDNLDAQISLPVYDFDTIDYLAKLNNKFYLNVKVDTGTSRLGFRPADLAIAISKIEKAANLNVYSIFSHYAESESADQNFTKEQLKVFNNLTKDYKKYKLHTACSAATISLPEARGNMIRVGIGFYGLWPSKATADRAEKNNFDLKPILSWKTKVVQVKNLQKGDTIGYNRTYKCTNDCHIAVLPIGYNEGYDRLLSNQGEVLILGQRCKIRGNICMNLSMVEIPEHLDIKIGEVVTLLGSDQSENISAEEIAVKCQTINYEVVTRINPQIKRILV